VLRVLAGAIPRLARTRRMTQAERDSLYILDARRQLMWREQGRPVPIMPIGGGAIPLPLFSPGPSPAKRMRDSVVHHDNLLRLRRIAERAAATKPAARGGADSLAKRPVNTVVPQ